MSPLFLDSVIWAMATILFAGGAGDAECTRVVCESQLRAIDILRRSLTSGRPPSDAVISCIASLSLRVAEPEERQEQQGNPTTTTIVTGRRSSVCGGDSGDTPGQLETPLSLGLFQSLGIERLGGLHITSHMMYTPEHYGVYQRLLASRGGIETITLPGIAERLTLADLYNSCHKLSRPNFSSK
jgi:hypothetical protein